MRDWKVVQVTNSSPTLWELARQCLSSTQKGYDLIASKFDHTPYRTDDEILKVMSKQFEMMGPFDSALDICCGTGAMSQILLPQIKNKVVGFDLSAGMMKVARQKMSQQQNSEKMTFVQGRLMDIPFVNHFDLAICFGGLGHVLKKEEKNFLEVVHRALKSGGQYVFVAAEYPSFFSLRYWRAQIFNGLMYLRNLCVKPEFIMYYLTFPLPEVKQLLETVGFSVEIKKDLFPVPFGAYQLIIATKK